MVWNCAKVSLLFGVVAGCLFSQGQTTSATKDDWEEINFEFNSSILSDGYPSLLRLAELLQKNPTYRVRLVGHADFVGGDRYNEKLALARAETVKAFLVKYGARADQIETSGRGKRDPKVDNKTPEGRFMNRRVVLIVTDAQGNRISAGGIGEAIRAIEQAQPDECCKEILKKLDEMTALLREMKGDNDRLRDELAKLREDQAGLRRQVEDLPKPPEKAELAQMMESAAQKAIEEAKPKRFSLLALNVGPDLTAGKRGNITFSGRGRYFAPFGRSETHALQAEGEYLFYKDRQEGQFDIGLVNRFRNVQAGLFSSFKHVNITEFRSGGSLGQGAFTFDYLFPRGRIGFFGTKGFLDDAVLARTPGRGPNEFLEHYLKIVDQVGASTAIGLYSDASLEANFGALFRRGGTNRPGGTVRFIHPINPSWAFTVEAGLNETLVGPKNSGKLVFGFQLGSWVRPKEFAGLRHPVPVDIPRLRYEVLTRRVRTGNAAPVADAGPDQIGVAAGTIRLDGSGSFDPDGDPLTFQWTQIAGPTVSISGMNEAVATFQATEGQTYGFRLTVKDDKGAQAVARVTVTTTAPERVRIVRFTANPSTIRAGQTTTIVWELLNAEQAEISGLGPVDAKGGTSTVTLNETTMYVLTARNRNGEVRETITVTVERPEVRILRFTATPATIHAGETATLAWETETADEVTLSGIGSVRPSGATSVSPTQTTTYTITARNRFAEVSTTATVQVTPAELPRIIRFAATPVEILPTEQASLVWLVENATEVSISSIGKVETQGTSTVSPADTTTYTLTAKNNRGEVSATAVVTVVKPVRVLEFAAEPAALTRPGDPITLRWRTENATEVVIAGLGSRPVNGTATVNPSATTIYSLVAYGKRTQASAMVIVNVGGTGAAGGLVCDAGTNQTTTTRNFQLRGSASDSRGLTLTYSWRVAGSRPAEITGANTLTPTVTFLQGFGDYVFELTVTNSAGERCVATTRVNLIDP